MAEVSNMKYKIVFLGDQGVGKTSLILRFTQDSFDVKYMVSYLQDMTCCTGYYWDRLSDKDSVCGRQNGPTVAVGHGGTGKV